MLHGNRTKICLSLASIMFMIVSTMNGSGMSSWKETGNDFTSGEVSHVEVNNGTVNLEINASSSENWTWMYDGAPTATSAGRYPIVFDSADGMFLMFTEDLESHRGRAWTYNLTENLWSEVNTIGGTDGYYYNLAFDSRRDLVELTNGDYTWNYNVTGNCWTQMHPAVAPYPENGYSVAYDRIDDCMLFYTTYDYGSKVTWLYNLANDTWQKMPQPTPQPPENGQKMIYDPATGLFYLFGSNDIIDTWTYRLSDNVWTNITPAITPPLRISYSMAFDEAMGGVVLFGGLNQYLSGDQELFNDTWWYDIQNNTWTNKTSAAGPQNRGDQSMEYDSLNNKVVLFGGLSVTARFGDTWIYDPQTNDWTEKIPFSMPRGRADSVMAYDADGGDIVLFGGLVDGLYWYSLVPMDDIWLFNVSLNAWTNRHPEPAPPAMESPAMVYDSRDKVMILFGGYDYSNNLYLNETWSYNVKTGEWTNLDPPDAPSGRTYHGMAYDVADGVTVLFGGYGGKEDENGIRISLTDTWTYNYSSNTWTEMNTDQAPSSSYSEEMVYDNADGLTVLVCGNDSYLWIYNFSNNNWSRKTMIPDNQGRSIDAMFYSASKGELILYSSYYKSLLLYNMNPDRWVKKTWSSPIFGYASDFAIVYDSASETIFQFGGFYGDGQAPSPVDYGWIYGLEQYFTSGIYTSRQFDTGGKAFFGSLQWEGTIPRNTSIKFQIRTSDTPEQLNSTPFTGPDGTANTYYSASNQPINSNNNGTRWFQYQAYLTTVYPAVSPVLKSVTINYNLLQSLQIESPKDNDNWNGSQNITWTDSDPDNDSLTFSIYLENVTDSVLLASALPNGATGWVWNTTAIPNGTYRIRMVAADNNPSIPLSVTAISGNFTIFHPIPPPPPNHPPHVELRAPLNNSVMNTSSVRLSWNGTDPDGDSLTFTVQYSDRPLSESNMRINTMGTDYLDLEDLTDNTTYCWTVYAIDNRLDGIAVQSEIWIFTINLPPPPVNHPPRITSAPPSEIVVGDVLQYNLTAGDADGDRLSFSLVDGPPNMYIDMENGELRWIPETADVGNQTITVIVMDGKGGMDKQTFTLNVLEAPKPPPSPEPPRCKIAFPTNSSRIVGRITIRGTAVNGTLPLTIIQIRIDGGNWTTAIGLENWTLTVNSERMENGLHIIEARAFDGSLYSDTASVEFTVANPEPFVSSGGSPWCLPAIIIVVVAGLGILFLLRKRKE